MTTSGILALAKARRMLRRAATLGPANQSGEALALALRGADLLGEYAERDSRRRGELITALLLLSELHLAAYSLRPALDVLDELVGILERSPCPGDTDEQAADRLADALTRRADTHRLSGDRHQAAQDLERALRLAVSPLQWVGAHNASGILAKDDGRYADAGDHYAQSRQLLLANLEDDHPAFASLHHNLAGLAYARGDYGAGEPDARRALELRTRSAGPGSAEVAADMVVLGALLAGQGRALAAESTFLRALELWTRHRGGHHYEAAATLHHLGTLYAERGELERAREQLRRALAIKTSVLGTDHDETVGLAVQLAQLTARCDAPVR